MLVLGLDGSIKSYRSVQERLAQLGLDDSVQSIQVSVTHKYRERVLQVVIEVRVLRHVSRVLHVTNRSGSALTCR